MDQVDALIEILERACIKYEVDQSVDEDGCKSLDVHVYDDKNGSAVFAFNTYDKPDLMDFKIQARG